MKSISLITFALSLLCFNTSAFESIDCSAQSMMAQGELKVNLSSNGDQKLLTVIGAHSPIAEYVSQVVEEDMKNISDLIACGKLNMGADQEICSYQYAVDNGVLESRVYIDVQMIQFYQKEDMGEFSFDISKIASATRYNIGEASKFGQNGLTVFFDKNKKVLGKTINLLEVMDCK